MLPRPPMLTTKNRGVLGLLSLLILAGLLAGCRPPAARALIEGKRLLDAGDATNAIAEFQLARDLLPTNATAWNYLGLAFHQAGQVTNAIGAYQKALTLSPDLSEASFNLGCLWLELKAFDKARDAFTAYTLRHPNQTDGWLKLGWAELRLRDATGAEKSFSQALKLSPKNSQACNGLGLVALQRNRPRDAVQHFSDAIQGQPVYRPALLNLALTLQQQLRDRPQALQRYREYLALAPKAADWNAVNATAQTLEQELTRAPSLPTTNQVVQTVPPQNLAKPTTNAGPRPVVAPKVELPTNPVKPAIVAKPAPSPTQTVVVAAPPEIKTTPDLAPAPVLASPPAQPAPAEVEVETNAVLASAEPKKRSLVQRLNPLNLFKREPKTDAHATPLPTKERSGRSGVEDLAAALPAPAVAKREPVKASPPQKPIPRYAYRTLSRPAPGNRREADRLFAQGVQAQQAGKPAEAVQAYRVATQADPAFFKGFYNLGLAAAQAGNLGQSLAAYENALAILPDSVDARYNFALGLKQGGYLLDAAVELEQILVSHPQDTRARLAVANLYAQQLRQPEKAREHYNKVLEFEPRHPQADAIRYWLVQNPG